MSKVFLTSVSLVALTAGSVLAADLPLKAPRAVVQSLPMWTGLYAGMNAGYGWDNSPSVSTAYTPTDGGLDNGILTDAGNGEGDPPPRIFTGPLTYGSAAALAASGSANTHANGFIGGAQIGYNYQFNKNYVAGIEGDLQGAGIRGTGRFFKSADVNTLGFGEVDGNNNFVDTVTSSTWAEKRVDWLATIRGRLGVLASPTLLIYGTGGLALGGVSARTKTTQLWSNANLESAWRNFFSSNSVGEYSDTRYGFTVGAGAEWFFTTNWTMKAEYLYYNLGNASWSNSALVTTGFNGNSDTWYTNSAAGVSHTRFDGHILRAGLNYHFNGGSAADSFAAVYFKAPPPPVITWAGFYAGLNGGYSWGGNKAHTTASNVCSEDGPGPDLDLGCFNNVDPMAAASLVGTAKVRNDGYIGGGQVGYNWLLQNNYVAGIEADIQGSGVSGSGSFLNMVTYSNGFTRQTIGAGEISAQLDWLGTVRGRLGVLTKPARLVYATGGLAYGRFSGMADLSQQIFQNNFEQFHSTGGAGSASKTKVGWTLGAGLEWMFMPNWSLKGEYLYYDLGSVAWTNTPIVHDDRETPGIQVTNNSATSMSFNGHIVRAGINYHFNEQVVAKY
jgi:opacity protein-like surface antigen